MCSEGVVESGSILWAWTGSFSLTVTISGLPNHILWFTVWQGCEPCRTVEGRKCNKNGRRPTADYRYGTVRSPTSGARVKHRLLLAFILVKRPGPIRRSGSWSHPNIQRRGEPAICPLGTWVSICWLEALMLSHILPICLLCTFEI